MKKKVIDYVYNLCLKKKESKFVIPSIRWFVYKFDLTHNDVVKTFDFFKAENLFVTEQGSKTYVIKKPFLNLFKNDTFLMFGNKIERRIVNQKITKIKLLYEHTFEREFWLEKEIVLLSLDKIYIKHTKQIDIKNGVDFYIKNNFKGKKIVQRESMGLDITNFQEHKKMKYKQCIMTETKIFNEKTLLSHSFSLTPWKFFKDFKTEIMT